MDKERFGFFRWIGEIILTWEVVIVVYYLVKCFL